MAHTYSRDKLEESRRKKKAAQQAQNKQLIQNYNAANKNKPQQQISAKTNNVSSTRTNGSLGSAFGARQNVQTAAHMNGSLGSAFGSQQKTQNRVQRQTKPTVQAAAYNPAKDTTRRATAARNREAQRIQTKNDHVALQSNMLRWHQTSDPAQRASLHQQNNQIRNRLGLLYDGGTGTTYTRSGKNLSLGTQMVSRQKPYTMLQRGAGILETKEIAGQKDRVTAYPTISQRLLQGVTKEDLAGQTGENAHKVMRDLFNRSDETWSDSDTLARDNARKALTDEMSRIYAQYGLQYIPRDNVDSADVMRRLRAAGADNQTLAYVQENIDLRNASDRLGQGMTAVGNRLKASIPSLIDTVKQELANRNESSANDNYTRLYEQEQQLEAQLQNMISQNADGSVPADYQAVYDELQRVRNERNSIAVQKGVDPNKWSQRMLREANEAQMNASAGLAPAPRWLTDQAISLAGNAPSMAASAIPVVGPAIGTAVTGAQAAGQRAFELNEQGKSAGEALGRGLTSGIIEAATEKLPLEQMADILHSGGTNAVKSILRQMGTEATEEGVSYLLNYVADRAAADPDARFSLAELVQSAAGGAFGGLVFGAAGNLGARLASNDAPQTAVFDDTAYERDFDTQVRRYDAELRQAQNLPEGPIKEKAVQNAQEKLAQTIENYMTRNIAAQAETAARNGVFDGVPENEQGFVRKKIPTYDELIEKPDIRIVDVRETPVGSYKEQRKNFLHGEEAQQLYRQPVMNYDTGEMVFVTPKTLEHSFSNGGQLQISAAKQIRQIIEQSILTNAEPITHGDSNATGIYTLFGAVQTENGIQPVKLKVKEYQIRGQSIPQNIEDYFRQYGVPEQYASAYDNKVLSLESIEKEDASSSAATMPFGVNDPSTSSYITVADLLGLVNGDASRYLPQNKSGDVTQVPNAAAATPSGTPEASLASPSPLNTGIQQNAENSNGLGASSADIMQDTMQYGKTPEQAVMEERIKRNARPDTDNIGLQEQTARSEYGDPYGYVTDENREFFSRIGAGKDLQPTQTRKTLFEQDMSRVKWLSDTDYKARHEQSAELRTAWEQVQQLDKKIEQVRKIAMLSDMDEQLLKATLINRQTTAFNGNENQAALLRLYQLEQERNTLMRPLNEYSSARREAMNQNAAEAADLIATYAKDKKFTAAYSRETMERNHYDIFGKDHRAEAEKINGEFIEPVHKAVADKTKYVNTLVERIKKLKLNKHESAMVQMLMERENGAIVEYAQNNHIKLTPELAGKLKNAAQEFRACFDDLYERICDTLIANGMWDSIPGYLKDYAPHYTLDKPENMLQRIRFALGLGKDSTLTLPTDLAGITDEFRPGKKWFGNLLHREGEITDYDAVAGFERYVNTAGDVIFLTDCVQNLRSLEDAVRYRLSDEGTKAKIDELRNNVTLEPLSRYQQIDQAYNTDTDSVQRLLDQKHAGMTGYVSNLREYINNLAGKKSKADRGWEDMLGRQMYNVARNAEGRIAANMTAANPGSWITNFIPITQAAGEVSTPNLIRAMKDTIASAIKDDGFEDGSAFLTNRRGIDGLNKTLTRKVSDLLGRPMECIDEFTANVVTRGKYLENIQKGMDVQSAFDNADQFAANLMADRSQGAMPTAFNAVNPVRKVFTVFQLEVNNQLSYLFKDLPRAKQSASKLAWAYTKIFVGAYAFNTLYHELTGRDSAFDPIGMILDAFGLDPLDDDEDKKKKKPVDVALSLGSSVAQNLPFVGGVLGGGRVPISGAIPDFGKLAEEYRNGYDNKRLAQDAIKEGLKPAIYLLPPFGGGAINKAAQGAATMLAGGSYTLDKNGKQTLQFPVFGQSPRDWAQAVLFGKSSLKEAQDWADNGYDSLNAQETEVYEELKRRNKVWHADSPDNSEAVYAAIKAIKAITADAKEKYGSLEATNYKTIAAGKAREMLLNNSDLTDTQKKYLDTELLSGGEVGNYTSKDAFDISQNVREARQDDAYAALQHGVTPEMFARYDQVLQDLGEEVDADGKSLYGDNEKLGAVMEQVQQDESLTDAQKQAIAGYVLLPAMSENDRKKYEETARGKISAADYVRFKGDLNNYEREFEGTDTDNAANVKRIIDGYENLNDEQKSVLMSIYSDNASKNLYHVSTYEQQIDRSGSFYSGLTQDGKNELRSMLNEYESNINDGTELKEWKAKAYMAEKEAGISPATYAMFRLATQKAKGDKSNVSQEAAQAAVNAMDGLTPHQKAYLYQSVNASWKKNPFGSATVGKYESGMEGGINPVEGSVVSSPFGPRKTFTTSNGQTSSKNHHSIDLAAAAGTPIKAFESGKVTANGWVSGYGWTIEVTHPNGLISQYHHMQNQSGVAIGTEVKQGQQIGSVGSTGNSTGPHLDLSIIKDGTYIDPASVIPSLKDSATGYISTDAASYGALTAAAQSSGKKSSGKSSGGSKKSGGTTWSGMKNLDNLNDFKGLPKFG